MIRRAKRLVSGVARATFTGLLMLAVSGTASAAGEDATPPPPARLAQVEKSPETRPVPAPIYVPPPEQATPLPPGPSQPGYISPDLERAPEGKPTRPVPPPIYVPSPGTTEEVPPRRPGPSQPGYVISTAKGDTLTVGGYIHTNARLFVGNDSNAYVNQFLLRQVRPVLEGTIRDHLDFRLLPDFAGGKVVVQEAWADVRYFSAFKLRVGKFKVPLSLERLQNSNAVMFVERAFPTQLASNRDVGAQLFGNIDGVFAYELGIFDGTPDNQVNASDGDTNDDKEGAARVFLMPFALTKIAALKQLGFGASASWSTPRGTASSPMLTTYVSPGQNTIFAYAGGNNASGAADPTKTVVANGDKTRWDLQGYYYWGPLGLQAEYIRSLQDVTKGATSLRISHSAWETTASVVLTGENATFRMLIPDHPFDPAAGQWGAVELKARIHQIHFDDALFSKGFAAAGSVNQAHAWGLGMNWYLDAALRFQVDFEHTQFFGGLPNGNKSPEQAIIANAQTVF
jgi:phosphate-selective porin OprO/OprP